MAGTSIQILRSIIRADPSPKLHSSRPCMKSFYGSLVVALAQHNNVPPSQPITPIHISVKRRTYIAHKILPRPIPIVPQRCANNLLHHSAVKINTWTESRHLNRSANGGYPTRKHLISPSKHLWLSCCDQYHMLVMRARLAILRHGSPTIGEDSHFRSA